MDQSDHRPTLTTWELEALNRHKNNLTDAHPRYAVIGSQREVIRGIHFESFLDSIHRTPYEALVRNFRQAFYALAGQDTAIQAGRDGMLCYSASLCIQIIASFIRSKNFTVALLEPGFDNIVGILQAEKIRTLPFPEEQLKNIDTYLNEVNVDAVWITIPNNPTGTVLSESEFRSLVAACKKRNLLLVVDFCFRFFCRDMATWNQYALLEESGVTYAAIEDTGKTWSIQDLKIGMVQSSLDIYNNLHYYYDNHLLSLSPFILKLLTELICDTQRSGLDSTIFQVVNANGSVVAESIVGTALEYASPRYMPIAWLKITDSRLSAAKLCELCRQKGVHVLPGQNFFWNNPERGRQFIRVSLVRDPSDVQECMRQIREILLNFASRPGIERTIQVNISEMEIKAPDYERTFISERRNR